MKILTLALSAALALTAVEVAAPASAAAQGYGHAYGRDHAWRCRNNPRYRMRHDCRRYMGRHHGRYFNNGRYYSSRTRTRVCRTAWYHGERQTTCRYVYRYY